MITLPALLIGMAISTMVSWLIFQTFLSLRAASMSAAARFLADEQDQRLLNLVDKWTQERRDANPYNGLPAGSNYQLTCNLVAGVPVSSTFTVVREALKVSTNTSVNETLVLTNRCVPAPANWGNPDFGTHCERTGCPLTCGPGTRPQVTAQLTLVSDPATMTTSVTNINYPSAPGQALSRSDLLGSYLCYSPFSAVGQTIPMLIVESRSVYFGPTKINPMIILTRRARTLSLVPISGGSTQYIHTFP